MDGSTRQSSSEGSSPFTGYDVGPVYYDQDPKVTMGVRILGGFTVFMAVLAFIFCMVKGSENSTSYLLACNIIISGLICIVTGVWYRGGQLQTDKYWFIIVVCGVMIFQCLITDIFVFNAKIDDMITTTPAMTTVESSTISTSNLPPT